LKCGALIEMDNDQETPFPVGLREGIYRVRLLAEWAQWHSDQVAEYISGQQQLL
jgi:hypothetical protein